MFISKLKSLHCSIFERYVEFKHVWIIPRVTKLLAVLKWLAGNGSHHCGTRDFFQIMYFRIHTISVIIKFLPQIMEL